MLRHQAITNFLNENTHNDLAQLYNLGMECQVNVAQDDGERIEGDFHGRQWHGWTDPITGDIWKSFRIPHNANSEPTYEDRKMTFSLPHHAEGIGMTGWDWQNQVSRWVAYDFDAISGHSEKHATKLEPKELEEVQKAAAEIPWVSVRKSTSGKGLHLYVFTHPVETKNHHEHAALARAILGVMSSLTGFDFNSRVDVCGGNMWVWHRKMKGTDGLELIKQGRSIREDEIPITWRDHIKVISGRSGRSTPGFIKEDEGDEFAEMSGQRSYVKLDDQHQRLVKYLADNGASHWWNQDHRMLVAHTHDLQSAHQSLGLRGIFHTVAEGREKGMDHNCFMFPLSRGGWVVRRYTKGTGEHSSWNQDGNGWTFCYFNVESDLATSSRTYDGLEDDKGAFVFTDAEKAEAAAKELGAALVVPDSGRFRTITLKTHKDGRLAVTIERTDVDNAVHWQGWLSRRGPVWFKLFNVRERAPVESDLSSADEIVRHLVTPDGVNQGWVLKSDEKWHDEPLIHVRAALEAIGYKSNELKQVVGGSIVKPWIVVNEPFQPKYVGSRQWNRKAAQFRFPPTVDRDKLIYNHWSMILNHCGRSLDNAVKDNEWARLNGLKSGSDYLKCWLASLFQEPGEPLPYLFMYGPQDSGKSIFHEAVSMLMTEGYQRADQALCSQQGFNAELQNKILCVVEETDLQKNKNAYNRIKDWVTSLKLPIHRKGETPYQIKNTTHWVQCSNDRSACPVFPGDTRIVILFVDSLAPSEIIPKKKLLPLLEKEAPDFLGELLRLELPSSPDRLNIPVVASDDKIQAERMNQTLLEQFLDENCHYVPGVMTSVANFHEAFTAWLEPVERGLWSKNKVSRNMPAKFPRGRATNAHWHYGNLSLTETEPNGVKLVLRGDKLVQEDTG